jgi:hypothetical protein
LSALYMSTYKTTSQHLSAMVAALAKDASPLTYQEQNPYLEGPVSTRNRHTGPFHPTCGTSSSTCRPSPGCYQIIDKMRENR